MPRRLEHEHREVGELTASELARPAENSPRAARNALRTIERDTEEATGRMRALLPRAWLRLLIVGLNLSLGIFGGSWAAMRWLWTRIPARTETANIREARQTLARMELDTWRIALLKIEGEQAVVLSAGTLDKPRWNWRERPAAKLSRE